MEYNNREPIYLQIANDIKYRIVLGALKKGEKLLSGRDMAEKMKVNPNTMARVYQELERQGIVFTRKGMGTYITEDANTVSRLKKEITKEMIRIFIVGMKKVGFESIEIITVLKKHLSEEHEK